MRLQPALEARVALVAGVITAISVAGGPVGTSAADKGKKRAVTTGSSQVGILAGTTVSASASCRGKTHATGGGYAVSPSFANPSGLRSVNVTSNPVDNKTWIAGGSAFDTPQAAGSFTTHVRCESSSLGRIATIGSSSFVLNPGAVQDMTFNCPARTHVISGGYAGTGPVNLTSSLTGPRIFILQSRRTAAGQWTVTGFNNPNATSSALLTGYAVCERNAKGTSISEASGFTPLINDLRAGTDATCTGKRHAVSGGFVIEPRGLGPAVFAAIDENLPVGNRGWRIGLYEFPGFSLPPGSSLAGYAYCKKDKIKKK